VFEQEQQTRRCAGGQTGFVQHIAERNTEASADESCIDSLKNSKVYLPVNGFGGIMEQVIFGNFSVAEKGFEYRIPNYYFSALLGVRYPAQQQVISPGANVQHDSSRCHDIFRQL